MSERVFIIHGWDGHPNEGWFPWLKTALERQKGHFREEDGVKELPSALKAVLEIAKL